MAQSSSLSAVFASRLARHSLAASVSGSARCLSTVASSSSSSSLRPLQRAMVTDSSASSLGLGATAVLNCCCRHIHTHTRHPRTGPSASASCPSSSHSSSSSSSSSSCSTHPARLPIRNPAAQRARRKGQLSDSQLDRRFALLGPSPKSASSAALSGRPENGAEPPCASSRSIRVLRITPDAQVTEEQYSAAYLLRMHQIHARDLLVLKNPDVRRIPPLILPRSGCVIFALGQVKGIILPHALLLLDPEAAVVQSWLENLEAALKSGGSQRWLEDTDEDSEGAPFEMVVLEEALREVCNAYHRRVALYQPLLENLLSYGELAAAEPGHLQRILLLKDSLSDFDLEVADLMKLCSELLENDEDMLGLLLTARENAAKRGEELDLSLHDEVELMLESYHRQLTLTKHNITIMMRHIQSKQEFMAISLDVYRNRMSKMNVQLGIGAVSIGICTAGAGYLGMNVDIPESLLHLPHSFWTIAGTTMIAAAMVHGLCTCYLQGNLGLKKSAKEHFHEINALQNVLRDMHRLDVALMSTGKMSMSHGEFKKAFEAATPDRKISDLEVDIIFRSLDKSGDGILQECEFRPPLSRHARWL